MKTLNIFGVREPQLLPPDTLTWSQKEDYEEHVRAEAFKEGFLAALDTQLFDRKDKEILAGLVRYKQETNLSLKEVIDNTYNTDEDLYFI